MRTRRTTICRLLVRLGEIQGGEGGNRGGAEGDRRGDCGGENETRGRLRNVANPTPGRRGLPENSPAFHDLAEMELTSDVEGVGFEVEESGSRSGERRQPRRDDDIRNRGQGWCDRRTGDWDPPRCAHRQASSCQRAGPSAERELCAQRSGVVAGSDQARVWRREGESFPSELRGQQVDRRKPGQNERLGGGAPIRQAAPCDSEFEGASRGRGRHAVDGTPGAQL